MFRAFGTAENDLTDPIEDRFAALDHLERLRSGNPGPHRTKSVDSGSVVLDTSDGTLLRYTREFDRVKFEFSLWDETVNQVVAVGVTRLEDTGTWEADAVVRVPEWDGDGRQGFGIVTVDDEVTLRFAAERLDL